MSNASFYPTTVRARGIHATSRSDGNWTVNGRGMRNAIKTADELQALLSAKPKRTNDRKQSRK